MSALTSRRHDDSDSPAGSLDDLLAEITSTLARRLDPEGRASVQLTSVVRALAGLLAFGRALETGLSRAAGGSGSALPGHFASVRGYVDQLLTTDAPEIATENLRRWTRDALRTSLARHDAHARSLQEQSRHIARQFQPTSIETECPVPGVFRWLGLEEIAFWREFKRRFRHLDADAVSDLAAEGARSHKHHEITKEKP